VEDGQDIFIPFLRYYTSYQSCISIISYESCSEKISCIKTNHLPTKKLTPTIPAVSVRKRFSEIFTISKPLSTAAPISSSVKSPSGPTTIILLFASNVISFK